jgi:TolB protein
MLPRIFLLMCVSGLLLSGYAAKVNLNVYASGFDSIPVGVVNFREKDAGGLQTRLPCLPWAVIANDFQLCGRFHVVRRAAADSAAFAAEGTGMYIDGEYSVAGGQMSVTCYLNDITVREHLMTKEYRTDLASVRRLAHRFADEIYELLFAERGFFESRVLFIAAEGGGKNVAVMDYDGEDRRLITKGKVLNLFPVFVDSVSMLWTSYLKGKPDIYCGLLADGKGKVFAASRGIQVSPAVSDLDGTVAYASSKAGNLNIYTCASDGSGTLQLTFGSGVETAPCWSPNGYQLAYVSDRTGNPHIYIMDADGANQRRITYRSRYCDSPAWSPKGDRIAFVSMRDDGKLDIWAVSPDGSNEVPLTDLAGYNEYPTWSPDGSLIGFISRTNGKSDFYVMRPDGSRVRRITTSGDVQMPDWGK